MERIKNTSHFGTICNLGIAIMAVFVFIGCEPAMEPTRQFTTSMGEHYSSPKVYEVLQSKKLVFSALFNQTAKYDFGDPALQSNKNKLMGFCDSNSEVHENSARFTWQWFNNRLEIYAYCYVKGDRQEQFIGVVDINQYNHYELEIVGDQYRFQLNDEAPVYMQRGVKSSQGVYYMLWPYFGGHIPAPHDVTIVIKNIH